MAHTWPTVKHFASRWLASPGLLVPLTLIAAVSGCGPSDTHFSGEPLVVLGSYNRPVAPPGVESDSPETEVVVAATIEELWADWGPLVEIDPPEAPGVQVVVAFWQRGFGDYRNGIGVLEGWRIENGELVLLVSVTDYGKNCVVPAVVVEATTVFAVIDDDRVFPGMPTAAPERRVRTENC